MRSCGGGECIRGSGCIPSTLSNLLDGRQGLTANARPEALWDLSANRVEPPMARSVTYEEDLDLEVGLPRTKATAA